jgi:hypothetical protein
MPVGSVDDVVIDADGGVVSVPAILQYYSGPVHSLTPDGTIYFSTAADGNQVGMQAHGIEIKYTPVSVRNGRDLSDDFYGRGFSLRSSPTAMSYSDFFHHSKVLSVHFEECEELLKGMGAAHVLPFDYIVRSVNGKQQGRTVEGGQGVQGPAVGVHADYTLEGAPRRLEQLAEPPKMNDVRTRSLTPAELQRAKQGRWCIINVWRNIRDEPLEKTPLGLLDCTTVRDDDFCCVEQRYVDRTGENYIPHYSERHQWYYFPRVVREEAVLLKAWDSREGPVSGKCSMHGAFKDPSSPSDVPDRESIEVRCLAIF